MKDLKRIQRLIKILRIIDGRKISRLELADEFGVSERQVYRDVKDLISAGYPLSYDRRTQVFYFTDGYSLKKLTIKPDELEAALLAKEMLSGISGPLSKNLDNLLNRLTNESKASPKSKKPSLSIRFDQPIDFSKIETQYNALLEAINESMRVEIEHLGEKGAYIKREIDPYRLFYSDGFWYLLAYCHQRQDIRTFAIDKIKKVFPSDRHFIRRMSFDPDKYMAQCWKKYSLGEPEEVTIRFSPEAAKTILRKKWHPSQEIKENKDGSIDFSVTVSGYDEIMRWALGWGRHARVVSPEPLRKRIKDEMKKMLGNIDKDQD